MLREIQWWGGESVEGGGRGRGSGGERERVREAREVEGE